MQFWGCCELFFTLVSQPSWCTQLLCTSSLQLLLKMTKTADAAEHANCGERPCRSCIKFLGNGSQPLHQVAGQILIKKRKKKSISVNQVSHISIRSLDFTSISCFSQISAIGRPYQKIEKHVNYVVSFIFCKAYNWIWTINHVNRICSIRSPWTISSKSNFPVWHTAISPACGFSCLQAQIQHFHNKEVERHSCKTTPSSSASSSHMVEVSIQKELGGHMCSTEMEKWSFSQMIRFRFCVTYKHHYCQGTVIQLWTIRGEKEKKKTKKTRATVCSLLYFA